MKTMLVLLGPTGVGKTKLSLSLAGLLHSPILSADSRQMYRDIPIGTASPTPAERATIPHYFVANLALSDYYSAAQYENDVITLSKELFKTHDSLLLTGGSMMYIDAVCKGIDDIPTISDEIRQTMSRRLKEEGLEKLQTELRLLDPEYARIVDMQNTKRVVHALEICMQSGTTYTSLRKRVHKQRPFRIVKVGLRRDREELYQRINQRVDTMLEEGLLEEARNVYPYHQYNSLNTVGYKELFAYFEGKWTLEEAIEKIKRNTRVYSRKQMTWFKRDKDIHWFHPADTPAIYHFLAGENLINL